MRIGIIGCGRIGVTLGYLIKERHRIIGVHDISRKKLVRACRIFALKKNPGYEQLIRDSEVLFFAVPDDEIFAAYSRAARFIGPGPKYLFHFSGLLPAEIFPRKPGVNRASIHPFATFPRLAMPESRKRYFLSVQGDDKALIAARRIFTEDHFSIKRMRRKEKGDYHLIAVFASNLLVGLFDAIYKLAKKLKWSKEELDAMVFSIIEDTVANIHKYGTRNALSGPVKRGDVYTIRRHVRLLKRTPNLLGIYKFLSQELLKYAPRRKKASLKKVLLSNSG